MKTMNIVPESMALEQICRLCTEETPDMVLVAGCTGSGKSTLAGQLEVTIPASIIHLDDYFKDEQDLEIVMPELNLRQWDAPSCYKWDILMANLREIFRNRIAKIPEFSHKESRQIGWKDFIFEKSPLILEGLYAMMPEIADIAGQLRLKMISIYIDVPPEIRWNRKYDRDVSERRENPVQLRQWFDTIIRPAEENWIQPQSLRADLKVITKL